MFSVYNSARILYVQRQRCFFGAYGIIISSPQRVWRLHAPVIFEKRQDVNVNKTASVLNYRHNNFRFESNRRANVVLRVDLLNINVRKAKRRESCRFMFSQFVDLFSITREEIAGKIVNFFSNRVSIRYNSR